MAVQRIVASKMKKNNLLLKDPEIAPHIPKTVWFTVGALKEMLNTYSTVFVKPDTGYCGNGIIRIKKVNELQYEICYSYTDVVNTADLENTCNEVANRIKSGTSYIIQQGIDLANYNGKAFDVRITMHRPLDKWQLTGWFARVSTSNKAVTNWSKGGKLVPLEQVLAANKLNATEISRELADLAHQISHTFGSVYGMRVLGVDMAVDKKGKVWFIEVNTTPIVRKLFKDFGNKQMYDKALKVQAFIEKMYQ
ncbi:YheC/YheD family protein [Polycladomyces subterraneus]|uniref:YheC/YheD family protein n=1 Tax=Polycladomyces subterraneus TaxID=1016997 RepID=A0ABT8IPX1_9BACL|nr:YheC/YheD family protein [Polycladomyces subterraneus]MDN4594164.1 YheC/YheD family protein [Polycladomyces subterraneus]